MRRIVKKQEPESLREYRESLTEPLPDEDIWGSYQPKNDARDLVTREQRELCAFCQGRMDRRKTCIKLAHIVPQKILVDGMRLDLVWTNIVGACNGGERTPGDLQHCDTRQANRPLLPELNPVQFANGSLDYDEYGGVYRADGNLDIQDQLDEVLGLNLPHIKEKRVAALRVFQSELAESADRERWLQDRIALLDPDNPSDAPLLEYADFLLWHLRYGKLSALAKVSQMGNGLP